MTIQITWKTTQKVGSKFLVCSVGPVRCGDPRQSTRSCSPPASKPPSQGCTRNPTVVPRAGAGGESVFTHSGSRERCAGKQSSPEGSSGKATDHDSGVGCSQLSPLDWQEKTPGAEELIQSHEKAVS